MKMGIRTKVMIMFVLLISIPLIALGINSYVNSVNILQSNLKATTMQLIIQTEESINNYMKGFEDSLTLMANQASVKSILSKPNPETVIPESEESESEELEKTSIDQEALERMLEDFKSYININKNVGYIYLGTKNSDMLMYPAGELPEGFDPCKRPWYQEAKNKNKLIWTDPYIDVITGKLIITAATPVYDNNNEFVGVLGIDLSLNTLADKINSIQIGKKGHPIILDKKLNVMTHKDKELIGKPLEINEINRALMEKNEGYVDYERQEKGVLEKRFAVFKKFEKLGWNILVIMYVDELKENLNIIINNTLLIGGIALFVAIAISLVFSQKLTKNIKILVNNVEKIKQGDFRVRFKVKSKDEIGRLADGFNIMIEQIGGLIKNIQGVTKEVTSSAEVLAATSEETTASAEEVAKTVDEIAKGASEQAADAEKGAQLTSNLSNKFNDLADSTNEMLGFAKEVMDANLNGAKAVNDLQEKTKLNEGATEKIESAINELDNKTKDIGNILQTISSIAEQTNLLALNASIEAARAGEAGRGFAVVADEIRKLAEESREAADEINEIVSNIQRDSNNTVNIMKDVKDRSREQANAVNEVNKSFDIISKSIDKITEKIESIGGFVNKINKDKDLIVTSIENISAVSEETAASSQEVSATMQQQVTAVEEVAKAANKLNELALKLNEEINMFKIN